LIPARRKSVHTVRTPAWTASRVPPVGPCPAPGSDPTHEVAGRANQLVAAHVRDQDVLAPHRGAQVAQDALRLEREAVVSAFSNPHEP
jgi:hypothetical protein